MTEAPERAENHTLRGATDCPALLTIRDIIEEMEPLASAQLDDYLWYGHCGTGAQTLHEGWATERVRCQ